MTFNIDKVIWILMYNLIVFHQLDVKTVYCTIMKSSHCIIFFITTSFNDEFNQQNAKPITRPSLRSIMIITQSKQTFRSISPINLLNFSIRSTRLVMRPARQRCPATNDGSKIDGQKTRNTSCGSCLALAVGILLFGTPVAKPHLNSSRKQKCSLCRNSHANIYATAQGEELHFPSRFSVPAPYPTRIS